MSREYWERFPSLYEPDGKCSGGVWSGIRTDLEDEADRIIFTHLYAIERAADKADVLTPWKYYIRRKREVYMVGEASASESPADATRFVDGTPDRSMAEGIHRRSVNPLHSHLNGHPRGVSAGRRLSAVGAMGSGPLFGRSLNTPSLWVDPSKPCLPTAATGVKDQPKVTSLLRRGGR